MIYLIILSFIIFLLAFAVKLLITYFFIKFFNRTNSFWSIFKPILLYELAVFSLFIIDPISLIYILTPIISSHFLLPIYILILVIILFYMFKIIMRKFSLLNLKKSLLIFFVMFLIITPIILYSQTILNFNLAKNLPAYEKLNYTPEMFLQTIQQPLFQPIRSPSEIVLKKIDRLNDIFLEGEFLKGLNKFIITII